VKQIVAKSITVLLLVVGAGVLVSAHDVISTKITWNREISRIVYARCGSCHHEGGSSFSLMTYQESRPWAKAVKEEVLERRMPPFGAIKGFGELRDDGALTQEELHLIADWVEGGAPEGDDPKLLPPMPEFKTPAPAKKGAAAAKPGPELVVDGAVTLKEPLIVTGARAGTMAEGSSIQAVAQKPDGSIEPLIWIYDYKPKYDRAYYFQKPLTLPAGTKLEVYPPGGGTLALLVKK
jgi:hypothetical protein